VQVVCVSMNRIIYVWKIEVQHTQYR